VTAAIPTGSAGFLARFEASRGRLPGDPAIRAAAAEAFRAAGLPGTERGHRPIEAWKYTSLRPLADMSVALLSAGAGDGPPQADAALPMPSLDAIAGKATATLVFVNGHHRAGTSSFFNRFATAPAFGPLAEAAREPLVALNTMLAEDGAMLDIPADIDAGTIILASLGTTASPFHPRHHIRLGPGARLVLLETAHGSAACLHNPVSTIEVGAGAHLTHVRLQDEHPGAFHLATIYVDIAGSGTYDGFTLNLGARLTRTEYRARLGGPGATAHLNGAQLLTGTQHADFTSVVRHAEPHGTSRQTVKNVLDGRSRGVFQGRIEVARGAQKTDGYQMNQALLLSPDAEIDTKPELEIFADDVKCSHGATVGELDAEQLFYLRARGISDTEARAILIRAFLTEALEAVTDDAIRAILEAGVQRWWERQVA
jgi:Fe-S cluster assembly protein SufD